VKREGTATVKLLEHTPLAHEVGELLRSLSDAANRGRVPWVQMESLAHAELLVQWLAYVSDRTVESYLFPRAVVDLLQPEMIQDRLEPDACIEKGMGYGEILALLEKTGMDRVKRVWGAGEFSIIGDVITVWPIGERVPYRLEFEDETVGSIQELDVKTWKVSTSRQQVLLHPKESTLPEGCEVRVVQGKDSAPPLRVYFSDTGIVPESVKADVELLDGVIRQCIWDEQQVRKLLKDGWDIYLVASHRLDKAAEIAEDIPGLHVIEGDIPAGFAIPRIQMMVLSDRELWGTVRLAAKKSGGTFADLVLEDITPGDYVVHEDHGVAVYAGLKTISKDGVDEQYLELRYAAKDRLYVPVNQLKRVTKYVGAGGKLPRLTRLGGGEWRRVKKRVREAVRKLALDLLRLYAVRELTPVSPVSESDLEISAFENEFPFVETDDQLRAIEDIKEDFKRDKPMDRVLVGDVGFGKTEVAMRAAYIAVRSGKQVAVLAPTTVLVEQHFRVFSDRFNRHGVVVEALSRFLTDEQARGVVSRIKTGAVDIVVGTHRLLSEDVEFKNLGLLVVDEEQKFGVAQKEKLKQKRVDTHVLSLSATPIPRTLNMALSGVRDISMLATPPEGRKPIENRVERFSWDLVKEAIEHEMARRGQTYYVHNRVRTIHTVATKLSELIPGVRIGVGHGQMSAQALSKIMHDFLAGEYDVLLCTTIIENGLDMEHVNTLVIERAEMFGLSQLYQIRGRIGRGDRQAYAYFLYHGGMGKPFSKKREQELELELEEGGGGQYCELEDGVGGEVLWDSARSRLDAIAQLKELGSGFALAQRDLEIRGAGSFLGSEQHGTVNAIGFSLYCKLLEETIAKLKSE
jgi:transcription-repair coupling factor (superfamily II helicase)